MIGALPRLALSAKERLKFSRGAAVTIAKYRDQKLFDAEMRLSILQRKLGEAERERDGRNRRRQPTRMIETIIEVMQGDIARTARYLDELRSA